MKRKRKMRNNLPLTDRQDIALGLLGLMLTHATETGLFDALAVVPNGPDIINEFCDLISEAEKQWTRTRT
jgi:hypothetical protein